MLFMCRLWNQLRFPAYQNIPELCPVLIVFVDQKRHTRCCPDVSQTCESFSWNTLRFLVYRCVEKFADISKTDRHDVWSTLGIQSREPLNSGLLKHFANRTGNDFPFTTPSN